MGLFDALGSYWAAHRFKKSPLGQALAIHTQEFFYTNGPLSSFAEKNKDEMVRDLYTKIVNLNTAENPALACRQLLAEYVLLFCGLSILCLNEKEKQGQYYKANPYISGTLHHHIDQAAENNEELAHFKWANPDVTAADLVSYANGRSAVMAYYVNALNIVRMELGDRDPQKDWFRPFVEAMMVIEEDVQREKLGLPQLVPGHVRSLPYSNMLDYVLGGSRNPFYDWTKNWPEYYLAGEGLAKSPTKPSVNL